LPRVERMLARAPGGVVFVVDDDRQLMGTIGTQQLTGLDDEDQHGQTAADVMRVSPVVLYSGDTLDDALNAFRTSEEETLAVVDPAAGERVMGHARLAEVLRAYNTALLDIQDEERGRAPGYRR